MIPCITRSSSRDLPGRREHPFCSVLVCVEGLHPAVLGMIGCVGVLGRGRFFPVPGHRQLCRAALGRPCPRNCPSPSAAAAPGGAASPLSPRVPPLCRGCGGEGTARLHRHPPRSGREGVWDTLRLRAASHTPSSPSLWPERFCLPSREPAGRGAAGAEAEAGGEGAARALRECSEEGLGSSAGAEGCDPVKTTKTSPPQPNEEPCGGPAARGLSLCLQDTVLVPEKRSAGENGVSVLAGGLRGRAQSSVQPLPLLTEPLGLSSSCRIATRTRATTTSWWMR